MAEKGDIWECSGGYGYQLYVQNQLAVYEWLYSGNIRIPEKKQSSGYTKFYRFVLTTKKLPSLRGEGSITIERVCSNLLKIKHLF